ncbi:response regulator [Rubritepida flocculans]|jgi:two-component system OmpR family response regulator|uniref:response regulator n=1 Tax=Rubritepida flocculans TaxID=182403 RepID=UPI00068600BE|nr:response regulator transcription factor [Rubritepida flocculans]
MSEGPERRLLDREAHVLVVEDDGEMRNLVTRLLREAGFRASAARDGREMWEVLESPAGEPDLVLLDVMLPGTSGLDLLRRLRERSRTPVMMLTARGEEMDRVLGLELGADDYVAKPFAPRELVARVRALLRRTTPVEAPAVQRSRRITFAGWALDTARRELTAPDGASVDLSGAEYDLLLAFLEHPGRVLSREQLLEVGKRRVSADPFDRTIDVQVSRLRRKIEPDEASPALIKTVRGAGYVLVAEVSRG